MTIGDEESRDLRVDDALAAWLRGAADDAVVLLAADRDRVLHRIDLHGIGPLLSVAAASHAVPDPVRHALRERLVAREFWEAQHRKAVTEALEVLGTAGAQPLVFKGTALAWSLYPRPAARVRGDTDVIIAADRTEGVFEAMEAAGFSRPVTPGMAFRGETVFCRRDVTGRLHVIDLHWRMGNSHVIAQLFPHSELWERSVPLPGLAPGARCFSNVDALLIACVHRRLHLSGWCTTELNGVQYPTPDSLTWLMDLDLLVRALSAPERAEVERRARSQGLGRIVAAALATARSLLGTPVPQRLEEGLADAPPTASDRYVAATPMRRLAMDFAALDGAAAKARYLGDLFFPPRAYIRGRFPRWPYVPTLVLYACWVVGTIGMYLSRGRETS